MHERGIIELPQEALDTIRGILHGTDPDKLVLAFEYASGRAFRCLEVIEASDATFTCLAERTGGRHDGLPVRAEMTFDSAAGEVRSIAYERTDRKPVRKKQHLEN